MEVSHRVKGLTELYRALEQLPGKVAANIVRSGLNAAAVTVRKAVVGEIDRTFKRRTGMLRKSIKSSTRLMNGQATAKVKSTAYYAPALEGGAVPHMMTFRGKRVEHPGIKESRFMRRAFELTARSAVEAAREKMRQRLTKEGINVPEPLNDAEQGEV